MIRFIVVMALLGAAVGFIAASAVVGIMIAVSIIIVCNTVRVAYRTTDLIRVGVKRLGNKTTMYEEL